MPVKKTKTKKENKQFIFPATKGALLIEIDDTENLRFEKIKGMSLKTVIPLPGNIHMIPAALANKEIVDYFELTPEKPSIADKGKMRVESKNSDNMQSSDQVILDLLKMRWKPAFVQIQVAENRLNLDPGYDLPVYYNGSQFYKNMWFPALPNTNGPRRKHLLSFFIDQQDVTSWNIQIKRRVNAWSLYKVSVFILRFSL